MKAFPFDSTPLADRADARQRLSARFAAYAALSGARLASASSTLAFADIESLSLGDLHTLEDRGTGRRALTPDLALSLLLDARAEGMFRAESNLRFMMTGTEWASQGEREVVRYVLMRDPEPSAFLELALIMRDFLASVGIAECDACLRMNGEDQDDDYHTELLAILRRQFPRIGVTGALDSIYAPELEFRIRGIALGAVGRMDAVATRIAGEPCATVSAFLDVANVLGEMDASAPMFARADSPKVLVAYYDSGIIEEALAVALDLRRGGIATLFLHGAKNLGKHFRQAERFGAEWIVIVGGREWDKGEVAIRAATSRDEISVPRADVASALRARMSQS